MKHTAFLIWLIAACAIALPSESLASYLIELKNGSHYVTHDYWEEGNQIKFKISGGEIGFSKDSVLKITDTDLPVKAEIITPETPSTEAEGAPDAPDEAATPTESKKTGKETPEDTEAAPESEQPAVESGPSPEQTLAEEGAAPAEKTGEDAIDPEAAKAYMDKKITLATHLERQMAALKREIDKKKDDFWIERTKARIRTTRDKIEALGREVAGKNSGVLPGWWNDIPVPAEE